MIILASGHIKPMTGPGGSEQAVTSAVRDLVAQRFDSMGIRVESIPIGMSNAARVRFARTAEASIYLAVECASDPRADWTHVDGATVSAPERSMSIANAIASAFVDMVPIRIRDIKRNDDAFLSKRLPGHFVTVSLGYLSNRADMVALASNDARRLMASAITAGVGPWVS